MNGYVWTVSSGGVITSGGSASDPTATVSWSTAGIQTISVRYNSPQGCAVAAPASMQVTVGSLPIPTLTGSVNVCKGATGITYSTQAGMTNYVWTVSSGGTITSGGGTDNNTVTVTWHTEGPQTVSVNFTNGSGCTAPSPSMINVNVTALPLPTLTGPIEVCAGTSGHVYTTEAGMTSYSWSVSPGGSITAGNSSTSNSITVKWNTAGAQTVSVNYANASGCSATAATLYNVTVNTLPVPTISGDALACGGSTAIYSTEPGMSNYLWTVSTGGSIVSGGTSTDHTITILWSGSGAQSVSVGYTNSKGCQSSSPTIKNITVSAEVTATLTGVTDVCQGSTYRVYSTQSGMTNYVWSIPAGATVASGGTSTSNSVTITWNGSGTQIISVYYTSTNGCRSSTATATVNVNPLPIPVISGDNDVCAGDAGVVYTTESGMSNYVWTISSGGTITSGGGTTNNTATVTWNTPGSQQISVRYTNPTGCIAEASTAFPVTVNPLPVVTCPADLHVCHNSAPITLAGATPVGGIYSGPGINAGVFNPATAGPGTHAITYTYSGTCINTCTFNIVVDPAPIGSNSNVTVCSESELSFDLQSAITNGITCNFTWTYADNTNVTGESNGSGDFLVQTLENNSYTLQRTVIYTITPVSEESNCPGTPFTVTVTVNPLLAPVNISWNSNYDQNVFEVCAGGSVLNDNDLDIIPTPANGAFNGQNPRWEYSYSTDGPWIPVPGNWYGGNYQFIIATELISEIGDYYFRFARTNSNGCTSSSDIIELHVISTMVVEAEVPIMYAPHPIKPLIP
jgi:hypothetical protein